MHAKLETKVACQADVQDLARLNLAFNGVRELPEALSRRLADPFCVEQPLVAVLEGRVVGFAALRVVPCVFYDQPHGELTELYVEEEYRELGVGRKLILLAEKIAKSKGVKELFVLTGISNQKARRLYNSLGYEDGDIVLSKELLYEDER
jgi:ribosomal protein S18 acetylase RimI-like enzyme